MSLKQNKVIIFICMKSQLQPVLLLLWVIQNVPLFQDYLCKPNKWDLPTSLFHLVFP